MTTQTAAARNADLFNFGTSVGRGITLFPQDSPEIYTTAAFRRGLAQGKRQARAAASRCRCGICGDCA